MIFTAFYRMMIKGLLLSVLMACQLTPTNKQPPASEVTRLQAEQLKQKQLRNLVQNYYITYSIREDFDHFIDFYADDAILEDIINGDLVEGKAAIRAFLNWPSKQFSLGSSLTTLVTEKIIIEDNTAVISGYFMPFYYDNVPLGPWYFTTWLVFNDDLKITKHTDIINYTPKAMFVSGQNANKRIKIPRHLILPK